MRAVGKPCARTLGGIKLSNSRNAQAKDSQLWAERRSSVGAWAYIWGGYEDKPIPLNTVVKKLQEMKFDGIELAAFPPHLDPTDFNTQAKRKEVKKLLDDHGLAVTGLAANFNAVPPATAKPTDYIEVVMTNLDICHDLDIPTLRADTISPPTEIPGGMDYETCFWRVAQVFNGRPAYAPTRAIKFVWEFEPGFLFNKPSEVVRMVYAVDHPNFTVLFELVSCLHVRGDRVAPDGREGDVARRRGAVCSYADRQDRPRALHRLGWHARTTVTPAPMPPSARGCLISTRLSRLCSMPATRMTGGRSICASGPMPSKPRHQPRSSWTIWLPSTCSREQVAGSEEQFLCLRR